MSRLEELIQELCPDGVERFPVGSFAMAQKGKNKDRHCNKAYSITKSGLVPTDEYFKGAKVTSDDTSGYRIVKRNWFVYSPSRIDVGSINFLKDEDEVIVSPLNVVFSIDLQKIYPEFLLYYLQSREGTWQIITSREGIEGTGRKLLPFDKFAKIMIPVPPLPVQHEIVRILDNFTELTAELAAELTARKKQYEYYRHELLSFKDNVKNVPLGELAVNISSGKNKDRTENGSYPVYGSTGIISATAQPKYTHKQILVARVGANAGFVHIADGKYDVSDNTLIIDVNNEIWLKFLYYLLDDMNLNQYAQGGGQPLITAGQLKKLNVVVPDVKDQDEIISILDHFDILCNDLSSGLPAEIEARRKQYEYYRDQLLTFKPRDAAQS